jgi:hypothetical protein
VSRLHVSRTVLALVGFFAALLESGRAEAFERQWHFGGGAGMASPGTGFALGPAVGLHGAYGLSDVFDARLELLLSQHAPRAEGASADRFYGAKLGVAYKLDVIQWIPYFGVTAGFLGALEPRDQYRAAQGTIGAMGGLDYAVGRNLGVGVIGTVDYALGPPATMTAGVLRVEYRFGW